MAQLLSLSAWLSPVFKLMMFLIDHLLLIIIIIIIISYFGIYKHYFLCIHASSR